MINVRRMTEADSPALLKTWNSAAIFDPIGNELFREKVWQDDGVSPDLRLVGEYGGQAAGFAVGTVRLKDDGPAGYVKMMAVSPDYQRHGLGSAMLSQLEMVLAEKGVGGVRPGESAPNYLTPGVDLRYTKATVLLENRGYERIGQSFNMEAELASQSFDTSKAEGRLLRDGFAIRRAVESDRQSVMSMLTAVWPAWRAEAAAAFANTPISLFLALRHGTVVAFSAYETNNRGTGWFGPMGTVPEVQGLGIGSVLLKRCLRNLREGGYERAIIPWVAPISFYLHHVGAEVRRVFNRYEKRIHDGRDENV